MSRLKRFAKSMVSGYALLLTNTLFTLASVPLATSYLSQPEFGLWALTVQIGTFITLIDFGMAGASRILIDYKDQRDGGDYGSVIQTTFLVSCVQGLLLVLIGGGLGWLGAGWLKVPLELTQTFRWLVLGQATVLGGNFLSRVLQFILAAHQRYDLNNYIQMSGFALNFVLLWVGFARGWGVYSLLVGQAGAALLSALLSWFVCMRAHFFPAHGCWGHPTWTRFRELFAYGRDIFLFMLGNLLINTSQAIVVTRVLGLEAAAVWSVCTRTFLLISQMINRVFDYSCGAFAEMIVRGERGRLLHRFRSIVVISHTLSVVAGVLFATCNQPFVIVWSHGDYSWPALNDALLAIWLILTGSTRCHLGLVGQAKSFGFLRYVYFIEGFFFVTLSLSLIQHGGITTMLIISILCTSLFSYPYGIWRTSRYFNVPWSEVSLGWLKPAARVAIPLLLLGALLWWLTETWSPLPRLMTMGLPLGFAGGVLSLRWGLDAGLRQEIGLRLPTPLQRWMRTAERQ